MDSNDLLLVSTIAVLVAGIAAVGSAWAAWRSARVAERAALLGAIPLLIPWVDFSEAAIKVKNRGASDAHETRWELSVDQKVEADGVHKTVIGAGNSRRLSDESGVVPGILGTAIEFTIRVDYQTSWGEDLTVERTYRHRSVNDRTIDSQGTRVVDAKGRRLRITH